MFRKMAAFCKSPPYGRTLARVLRAASIDLLIVDDAEKLAASVETEQLAGLFVSTADYLSVEAIVQRFRLPHLLLLSEPEANQLAKDGLCHVFGLRYPDAPPRSWELLSIARRLASDTIPPPHSYLGWGATIEVRTIQSDRDRDQAVGEVQQFTEHFAGSRLANQWAEVAHELIMNALYDAPADAQGRPLYAHRRQESIDLPPEQAPRFFYGCDGQKMVLVAQDPFGRLTREHVFNGIRRGLAEKSLDRRGGGAGLGLAVIHQASTMTFFDVAPGSLTQATAIFELDIPMRELRRLPRSLHYHSTAGRG